jgi:hypothetical protein
MLELYSKQYTEIQAIKDDDVEAGVLTDVGEDLAFPMIDTFAGEKNAYIKQAQKVRGFKSVSEDLLAGNPVFYDIVTNEITGVESFQTVQIGIVYRTTKPNQNYVVIVFDSAFRVPTLWDDSLTWDDSTFWIE